MTDDDFDDYLSDSLVVIGGAVLIGIFALVVLGASWFGQIGWFAG